MQSAASLTPITGLSDTTRDHRQTRGLIKVGDAEIDDYVLCGGLKRGNVVAITDGSQGDDVGRVIALHLLSNHLLFGDDLAQKSVIGSPPRNRVAIIDRTGTFPLGNLLRVMKSQLQKVDSKLYPGSDDAIRDALAHVDVTRVFDIEGFWEVVREIASESQTPGIVSREAESRPGEQRSHVSSPVLGSQTPPPVDTQTRIIEGIRAAKESSREFEIGDSQDEDEDEEDDDVRNADGSSNIGLKATSTLIDQPLAPGSELGSLSELQRGKTSIILVDNFTALVTELFSRKEKREANAHLTTLARALQETARKRDILFVLLNNANKFRAHAQMVNQGQGEDYITPSSTIEAPSIFTSNASIHPAIASVIPRFAPLHILLSSLPRSAKDAATLRQQQDLAQRRRDEARARAASGRGYDEAEDGEQTEEDHILSTQEADMAHVLEIISDEEGVYVLHPDDDPDVDERGNNEHQGAGEGQGGSQVRLKWISRAQRWCAFDIGNGSGGGRRDGVEIVSISPS